MSALLGDGFGKMEGKDCCGESLLVNSRGLWAENDNIMAFAVPVLLLQIAMIVFLNNIIHFPLRYLRIPRVVSQLLTGLIIGPVFSELDKAKLGTVLGQKVEIRFFSIQSQEILGTVSVFGLVLYFFIWGVKMDFGLIRRVGKRSLIIGVLAQILPFKIGLRLAILFNKVNLQPGQFSGHYVPVIDYSSMTSFPVVTSFLGDLKMTNSELGRHVISAAMVCDAMSSAYYTYSMCRYSRTSFIGTGAFLVILVVVIRPIIKWVIKQTPQGRQVKDSYIATIIIGTLVMALIVRYFGQVLTMTTFVIGLVIPDGPPMGYAIIEKLNSLVSNLLMPVFITTSAMKMYPYAALFTKAIVWSDLLLMISIFSVKMLAVMIPAVLSRIPAKDAFMMALIMCARGTVEVAHYSLVKDRPGFDQDAYTVLLFVTIFIASVYPNIIYYMYDPMKQFAGYNKRNIMSLSSDQTPRVLFCIQKNDNVSTFINLLSYSSPTTESPISISILHLIQLYGRSSPLFISHHSGTTQGDSSFSQNVIEAFDEYKRENPPGSVFFKAFTSVAPIGIMHNDIATLAMNEDATLIMIPFHKKWTSDGKLESEDHKLMVLNRSVLERAPSSVGIIVDRGSLRKTPEPPASAAFISFLMIFFGGRDDREALAYAKRAVFGSRDIVLTVINFKPEEEDEEEEEERVEDAEILKEIIEAQTHNQRVRFLEEKVQDGPQTALMIRSIVDEYDLIIVGRRDGVESIQTSGLIEWSEFPELGAIGDLLASSDLETKTSILVIQQQKMARHK